MIDEADRHAPGRVEALVDALQRDAVIGGWAVAVRASTPCAAAAIGEIYLEKVRSPRIVLG